MPIQFYGASESAADSWSGTETITGQKTFSHTIVGDISSNGTSYFTDICANSIVSDISSNGTSNFSQIFIGGGTYASELVVRGDKTASQWHTYAGTAQFSIRGKTDHTKVLALAYDTTNDYGVIQAGQTVVGDKPLILQKAGGNVGIGTTTPIKKLTVEGNFAMITSQNASNYWWFQPHAHLWIKSNIGSTTYSVGYFNQSDDTNNLITFTGQHRCILNKNLDETSKGLIVSSSGKYINLNNSLNTDINESLPICNITNTDNDKKVFGVISDKEDTNSNREYSSGNFVSCYEKTNKNEQRMFINSLGEGAIWVCNKNGSLSNGDYISSSSVAGYGMKQTLNEDFLTRYTVAKITCDCHFSLTKIVKQKLKVINQSDSSGNAYTDIDYDTNGDVQYEDDLDANGAQQMIFPFETRFLQADATQITEAEYNSKLGASEEVYIACFVGCTYHCG